MKNTIQYVNNLSKEYIVHNKILYKLFSEDLRKRTFTFYKFPWVELEDMTDNNFFVDIDKFTALKELLTEEEALNKFPAKFL